MSDILKKMGKAAFGGPGAKRPAAPATDTSPAPKKKVDPANGLCQGHQTSAPSTAQQRTEKRPPPFFIDSTPDWPTLAQKMKELVSDDMVALARGSHIRVTTSTAENFRRLQRHLCDEKVAFHTFTMRRSRELKVVLSGLPSTVTDVDICDALADQMFVVEDLQRLRSRRGPSNRWLLRLASDDLRDPDQRKASDIYGLTELLHVRIEVTAYKKPPGPPQCYHCQRFGHGSGNCGRPIRCVRCGGPHNITKCQRPSTEKTCCNCGGEHQANWRGCPTFAAARAAAAPRPARRRQRRVRPPQPNEPRRDEAPMECDNQHPEPVAESSTTDDEEGFASKKRRKRQPRNPDNRRGPKARPTDREPAKTARPQHPPEAPRQRPTPRKRIDWPPKQPATPQPTPTAEPAATIPAEKSEILAAIAQLARQLTELTKLIAKLVTQH